MLYINCVYAIEFKDLLQAQSDHSCNFYNNSFSLQSLEPFYDQFDPDFINIRKTVREVLQKEDDLNEIVQLVGKVCSDRTLHTSIVGDWQVFQQFDDN